MAFSYVNSKGVKYWLHKRIGKGGATLFFFSKSEEDAADLPEHLEVFEGPTGLPMVRKK